ncbi:MAG: radical SAM family heme chaperone HemW [Alphaproteobacteria bacterium]|nr:radical SAM family heme chaperone HemW [Alphaproteobacteria bacterium]
MQQGGFALYVHWPFCLSKCPYCDFNSHVRETVDDARWRTALLREIDHAADVEAPGCGPLTSIFFGGGTPSLMAPATAAAVIARVADRWGFAPDAEITLEANPTSVEAGRLADFRAAGVNRVSLGVQALDDDSLRALGRTHGADEALAAVRLAARLFDRYSFDLIYARPGQTVSMWEAELRQALSEAGDHVSLYQLTIEPGTAFHTLVNRGELIVPDEENAATLYETTQMMMDNAGFPAYEISNHATPGAESRHNLTYWRYGNYAGIGPGAHGRITKGAATMAYRRQRAPERWLEHVEACGAGTVEAVPVDSGQRVAEILMMGLRLAEGVSNDRFRALAGRSLEDALDARRLGDLTGEGLLTCDRAGLRATASGRQRLNALLAHLLA